MRPAPPRFLLLLALLSRSGAESGEEEEESGVPPPTNVVIKSSDFKTVVYWDCVSIPLTPHFTVEIKSYLTGVYKPVKNCTNIRKRKCDLSKEIKTHIYSHWARVKALIGSEESEYVETKEFILRRDGKISPPKLTLSIEDDRIKVHLYHPWKLPPIDETDCTVKYTGFSRHNEEIVEFETEECKRKCSTYISVTSTDSNYCVSARGLSTCVKDQGFSQSNESCIYVPSKQLDLNWIIIIAAVISGVGLIFAMYCVCKQIKRKIELPKSLVSVVRNLNSGNIFDSRSEARYLSVITSSPSTPASETEEVNIMEQVDPGKEIGILNPEDCKEETDAVSSQETANDTQVSIQEGSAEMSPDDEQSPRVKENYFHYNGSQTELCGIPSNPEPEPANTKMQQSTDLRSCNTFSGYDKPHVPLNMLIEVGEDESVIAYKHTDEVKG